MVAHRNVIEIFQACLHVYDDIQIPRVDRYVHPIINMASLCIMA